MTRWAGPFPEHLSPSEEAIFHALSLASAASPVPLPSFHVIDAIRAERIKGVRYEWREDKAWHADQKAGLGPVRPVSSTDGQLNFMPFVSGTFPRSAVREPTHYLLPEDRLSAIVRIRSSPTTFPSHQSDPMIPSTIPAGKSREFTIYDLPPGRPAAAQ